MLRKTYTIFIILSIFNPPVFAHLNNCNELFNRAIELRAKTPRMPEGFHLRLRDTMAEVRMTQTDLSRVLKFNGNSKISKVLLGQQLMILHDVVISANVLGVRTWWLLTGEGEKNLPSGWSHPSPFLSEYNKEDFIQEFKKSFGIQLKIAMDAMRITGTSLAKSLNYHDAKISKVVAGEQEFMTDSVVDALRLLAVDPSYLLDYPILTDAPSWKKRLAEDISAARESALKADLSKIDANLLIEALQSQGWHVHTLLDPTTGAQVMIMRLTK